MKQPPSLLQEELIAFLLNPKSYPHHPKRVRLVQTHASYVFIGFPYAYKVKKEVNFGFLDFSSLEKRRYYSEREVMLNRRLCPEIYLGVIPISLSAGKLTFGEGKEVVDYAVKMRKLQDRYFMPRLLRNDQVTTKDLDRLVSKLKDFYESETPTEDITKWGRIEKLKISTDENFAQTTDLVDVTISKPAFEAIGLYASTFYARNARLFNSRVREHKIRDCHGDLHLEHIHLAPGTLSIYDCIEFNDRFRYIDVASDVAFLAMDFDHYQRPDLSWEIAARMAAALRDSEMLRLMDFYKCYRAYVRGKVESLHRTKPEVPEAEQKRSRMQAESYFRLALRYAVCGSKPTALIIMGRIASGKSTLANALGHELGCEVISSDRVRKELAGVPLYQRGDESFRRRLYSEAMNKKTYKALFQHAAERLERRENVILDATFSRSKDRDGLIGLLDSKGTAHRFIEARAPDQVIKRRLQHRNGPPHEISDARLEDFEMLTGAYEAPSQTREPYCLNVATGRSMTATTEETLRKLVLAGFGSTA